MTCPEARFCANFTRLGFHPGFGLTTTLPEVIGTTNAALMFYTSRRVTGEEAHRMGLARRAGGAGPGARGGAKARRRDRRERAARRRRDAGDHARRSRRARGKAATDHELDEQSRLRKTDDFQEGVKAMAERRVPNFAGR